MRHRRLAISHTVQAFTRRTIAGVVRALGCNRSQRKQLRASLARRPAWPKPIRLPSLVGAMERHGYVVGSVTINGRPYADVIMERTKS